MMSLLKRTSLAAIVATVVVFGQISLALADDCADALAEVAQATQAAELSEEDADNIKQAVEQATQQQNAGDTDACLATLGETMNILGLE